MTDRAIAGARLKDYYAGLAKERQKRKSADFRPGKFAGTKRRCPRPGGQGAAEGTRRDRAREEENTPGKFAGSVPGRCPRRPPQGLLRGAGQGAADRGRQDPRQGKGCGKFATTYSRRRQGAGPGGEGGRGVPPDDRPRRPGARPRRARGRQGRGRGAKRTLRQICRSVVGDARARWRRRSGCRGSPSTRPPRSSRSSVRPIPESAERARGALPPPRRRDRASHRTAGRPGPGRTAGRGPAPAPRRRSPVGPRRALRPGRSRSRWRPCGNHSDSPSPSSVATAAPDQLLVLGQPDLDPCVQHDDPPQQFPSASRRQL